jgi:hypothetical protein
MPLRLRPGGFNKEAEKVDQLNERDNSSSEEFKNTYKHNI